MEQLISVIIPAYNAEKTVRSTIESVLHQTYENLEILLVDDCSTDGTLAILRAYEKQDPRVRVLRNEKNAGVSAARNHGVREARGAYAAFLDSDDIWMPEKLSKQAELLAKHPADMIYTGYGYMTAEGIPFRHTFRVPKTTNANRMLRRNVMSTSGLLVRRELLLTHPFRCDVAHEDLFEWITLLRLGATCAGQTETLHLVRLTGSGSRSGDKKAAAANRLKVYEQLGVSRGKSLFYWACYAVCAVIKYVFMRLSGARGG